jgi:hypothetical protein
MHFATMFTALMLFAVPVLVQTTAPAAAQTTCNRAPRQPGAAAPSPQLVAARRGMHQACAADMANFCSNVPRGCGAPNRCLMAHRSQLSQSCTGAWQNVRAMRGSRG